MWGGARLEYALRGARKFQSLFPEMVLESVSKSGQKPVSEYLTLESGSKTRRRTTDFKKGIF